MANRTHGWYTVRGPVPSSPLWPTALASPNPRRPARQLNSAQRHARSLRTPSGDTRRGLQWVPPGGSSLAWFSHSPRYSFPLLSCSKQAKQALCPPTRIGHGRVAGARAAQGVKPPNMARRAGCTAAHADTWLSVSRSSRGTRPGPPGSTALVPAHTSRASVRVTRAHAGASRRTFLSCSCFCTDRIKNASSLGE